MPVCIYGRIRKRGENVTDAHPVIVSRAPDGDIMKTVIGTENHKHFPKIGMRIIKSAIGIFICFLIDILRGGQGIVFYSQLAVLWCIRDYVSETKAFAFQRTIGTVIGAIYGLIVLVGSRFYSVGEIGYGLIVSVVIVLVLYTTVVLGQKQASYFSCVVFLSIVINHVSDINPYLFVWNRFLDTMIGIIVGVCVNCISFHRNISEDTLFLSGLDDTLLAPGGELSAYSRVELNRMIERGVKFTVSTIRTPASLLEPLRGINLSLPVIAMDGAALYNVSDNSYEKVYIISNEHSVEIQRRLKEYGVNYFTNVVIEDVLLIYYQDSENVHYNNLIEKMRKSPYRNYLKQNEIVERNVVYFMIIDTTEKVAELMREFEASDIFGELKITVTKSYIMEGCSLLKIYNKNATKENMLDYLKNKLNIDKTVTFGTIEGRYTHTIQAGEFNRVVKIMKRESQR